MVSRLGFTLVELIVVITILAILSTIAFISLQGYSASGRDSVRITDLSSISNGLNILNAKTGTYPLPDNPVNITSSGTLLGYQGNVGDHVKSLIRLSGEGKDPKDGTDYTYSTNKALTKFQLLGFLEGEDSSTNTKTPTTKGDSLGILLESGTLNPIQNTGTGVDLATTDNSYIAYFTTANYVSGTGTVLNLSVSNGFGNINYQTDVLNTPGLISYWKMDNNWNDSKGTNNGTAQNGVTFGTAKYGSNAGSFDGVNNYVSTGFSSSVLNNTNYSIEFWIKSSQFTLNATIMTSRNPSWFDDGFTVHFSNGTIYYYTMDGMSGGTKVVLAKTTETYNDNQWHYIVLTTDRSSGTNSVYVDGIFKNSVQGNIGYNFSGQNVYFGAMYSGAEYFYAGLLEEVSFYNHVLTKDEITRHYNHAN